MWDPETGGGFDGLREIWRQSQPGNGVDARLPLDDAARPARRPSPPMTLLGSSLVRRTPIHISADASRVIRASWSRARGLRSAGVPVEFRFQRVLELSEQEVEQSLDDVMARFGGRHQGLTETFLEHADQLSDRLDPERELSSTRRLLLGATFTSEYAIEGAALCNPSMVIAPDQVGVKGRRCPLRDERPAIGEGHDSSIGFRTGTISALADVKLIPLLPCHKRTPGRGHPRS